MYNRLSHTSEYKGFNTWIVRFEKIVILIQQFIDWKDSILKALNEHRQIFGIFCDIANVFDSVNLDILQDKLCYYGTHSSVLL
jgi:hypothetical protein